MMVGTNPLLLQGALDLVINSLKLSVGTAGAYNKIVGKAAHLPRIQQDDVTSLLITGCIYSPARYFYCFQN
jgi:hypothetical protein